MSKTTKNYCSTSGSPSGMGRNNSPASVSETRLSHFMRSAAPSERDRVLKSAMKAASKEQQEVVNAYNASKLNKWPC